MTKNRTLNSADPAVNGLPLSESQGCLFSPVSAANQSWRDLIEVHPAANLFRMMPDAELAELGKDIAKNGLKERIVLWTPERQCRESWPRGSRFLIDGRNRLEAMVRGIPDPKVREEIIRIAIDSARQLYGDVDPYEYVISANLHRRHLTGKQKREVIEKLLKVNPERSDRETARIAKVHHDTVGTIRADLESTGGIRQLEKTVGADGRARPVRRSAAHSTSKPKKSAQQLRDTTISDFSKLLHQHPADTLDDLIRLLRGEHVRITEIPLQKRVLFARAYMQALGVTVDDLSSDDRSAG